MYRSQKTASILFFLKKYFTPNLDGKLVANSVCGKELSLAVADFLNRLSKLGNIEKTHFGHFFRDH